MIHPLAIKCDASELGEHQQTATVGLGRIGSPRHHAASPDDKQRIDAGALAESIEDEGGVPAAQPAGRDRAAVIEAGVAEPTGKAVDAMLGYIGPTAILATRAAGAP